VSIAWSIYNSYVPIFLERLIKSSTVIGIVMTFDNIFGVIFQPYFGRQSDRKKSKYGRRISYMILGVPLAALFLIAIPWYDLGGANAVKILLLICAVIGMNFFMSYYRAPSIALMPDATPQKQRSKANGVINFMGGLGTVMAYLIGGKLFDIEEYYPFLFAGVLMVLALLALLFFYREPEVPYSSEDDEEKEEEVGEKGASLLFPKNGKPPLILTNRSLIYILLAIFFWFCGYNGVETFFTLYCTKTFGMTEGTAGMMLTYMAMTFLIFAIPAGFVGNKFGRKRTILAGIAVMIAAFAFILAFGSPSNLKITLIVAGMGWAFININSYPMIAAMAPKGETGKYTGFYYAFSFSANIVSPILFGFIADMAEKSVGAQDKYTGLFAYGAVMFVFAFIMVGLIMLRERKNRADQRA
jgi:MFS family permease